jgi:hypothetical protein
MNESYICPLNQRPCSCDPTAADKKLHPCISARRIGNQMRMFSSDFEGEAVNAFRALRRLVPTLGVTFNDVATVIENLNGAIEQYKYGDSDAKQFFDLGVQKGQERARESGNGLWADGSPQWDKLALWCQEHSARLGPKERKFVDDMAGQTQFREPTPNQARWLISIFLKLGGKREASI